MPPDLTPRGSYLDPEVARGREAAVHQQDSHAQWQTGLCGPQVLGGGVIMILPTLPTGKGR